MKAIRLAVFAMVILCGSTHAYSSEFTLVNSGLIVGVNGLFPDIVGHGFSGVSLPFSDTHRITRGFSIAEAAYAFDQTRFLTEFMLVGAQGPTAARVSIAEDRLYIRPDKDLRVKFDARFDFDLPAAGMAAAMSFGVYDPNNVAPDVYSVQRTHYAVQGMGAGVFDVSGEFTIPATQTWYMLSTFEMRVDPTALTQLGTGSGYMNIQFIPEPSGLMWLGAGALLLARRQRTAR
ncbi:MAG TPA: hypothetical protein P5081_09405 [Phycisphaerae bacterium]|nr:hypothetical protein [Phycisphaerae bacterium]HRW53094.1 hypothetical protein [Phycisphaerae bacterium]